MTEDADDGATEPTSPAVDLAEVAGLIAAALKQGNITVSADGEIMDLSGTALHGAVFEPIDPQAPPDEPDPDR